MEGHDNKKSNLFYAWDRRRRLAAVQVLCITVYWFMRRRRNLIDKPIRQSYIEREKIRDKLMNQLQTNEKCRDIIRMGTKAFKNLCEILRTNGDLRPTRLALVEEQVAKFLYILSHNVKNRTMSFFFLRSGETISRHFHKVLRSIISMEEQFLRQPTGLQVPPEIQNGTY